MDPLKHTAGRRKCLYLPFSLHLVHVLPRVIFASHVPSSSAILIVDIPYDWPPPFGSLEAHIWALAHDCGTDQTMMRKEELGKNRNVERGAGPMAQSGVSHNPSPDIIYIYIYILYIFSMLLRFILISCKTKQTNEQKSPQPEHCSLCHFVKLPILLN